MNRLGFWLLVLAPGLLNAQHAPETSAQHEFISGGMIRLHLTAGTPRRSESAGVTV
jgi:hypothetical protein